MEQQVQFVRIVRQNVTSYQPNQYQFRVERKHHWLQKIALWILRKLDCQASLTTQSISYDVVDTAKLMENLIRQRQEIVNFYHQRDGEFLLVGPAEFQELAGLDMHQPLAISLQYMWSEPKRDRMGNLMDYPQYTRCGLKVVVIPWMKGFLVLPKGFDKSGL